MTITTLARHLGVRLEIIYTQSECGQFHWRCHMRCVAFPARLGSHRPPYGWGATPELALKNYVSIIRGKRVTIHPYPGCYRNGHTLSTNDMPADLAV